jgi:hypothetical protein
MINIKWTLKTWCAYKSSNQYCYTSTYLEQTQMDIFVDCVVNKFGMEIFMLNDRAIPILFSTAWVVYWLACSPGVQ